MRKFQIPSIPILMNLMIMGILSVHPNISIAADPTVDERLERLERQLELLRSQTQQAKPFDVMTVEKRIEKLEKSQPTSEGGETGHMVFFRGGGAWATSDRGREVLTDVGGASGVNNGDAGYYIGAGLDLVMSKNIWGMMSKTWVLGEIDVEYKRWNSKKVRSATNVLTGLGQGTTKIQLTQLTVSVSPKILFMEGNRLRPWIIPVGLDFHVISPPSGDVTVLDIGAQVAVGAQYRIWRAFHLGVDGRFHLAAGETDTTNNFGTVGAYVGIAF